MSQYLSEDDYEIVDGFIQESLEAIEDIEPHLIDLENQSTDLQKVNTQNLKDIYRVFHSIKGSAGFLGLELIVAIAGETEVLLDLLCKKKLELNKNHLDILLELCDFFRELLTDLRKTYSLDKYEKYKETFMPRLGALINPGASQPAAENMTTSEQQGENNSKNENDVIDLPPETELSPIDLSLESFITPELVKQFVVESNELLEGLEQDILTLEENPKNKDLASGVFRYLHSLKGNAGLFGCTDIATICHQAENFMDAVRNGEVTANSEQFTFLLRILDFIRKGMDSFEKDSSTRLPGLNEILNSMKEVFGNYETDSPNSLKKTDSKSQKNVDGSPQAKTTESSNHGSKKTRNKPNGVVNNPQNQEKQNRQKQTEQSTGERREVPISGIRRISSSDVIRVDVSKLNELMDLVGEIVIAESMVAQHPEIVEMDLPGFEKVAMHLQKNIRSLQEIATSMRMIPLNGLFKKMIRLVRDVSTKVHKKIDLVIYGGETEVDRTVLEGISDPLVHILRNSIDHGIELPAVREKTGKNPTGKIILEAKQVGSEILILIEDDGKGIPRDIILSKAIAQGLVNDLEENLSDKEIYKLIFSPGLSTAEKLTDISGRGVGMDVVAKNIEAIRGRAEVDSTPGKGTRITLRIPLTTAIIDGMLMRVENAVYALPTLDIKESLEISESNIVKLINGEEVIKIREHLYPVLRIHELHGLTNQWKSLKDGLIVLAESAGKSICLFVDELIGQKQLVVKPLPDYLGEVPGVSGCTILGDGNICLIFDTANLIQLTEANI